MRIINKWLLHLSTHVRRLSNVWRWLHLSWWSFNRLGLVWSFGVAVLTCKSKPDSCSLIAWWAIECSEWARIFLITQIWIKAHHRRMKNRTVISLSLISYRKFKLPINYNMHTFSKPFEGLLEVKRRASGVVGPPPHDTWYSYCFRTMIAPFDDFWEELRYFVVLFSWYLFVYAGNIHGNIVPLALLRRDRQNIEVIATNTNYCILWAAKFLCEMKWNLICFTTGIIVDSNGNLFKLFSYLFFFVFTS